MSDPVPKTYRAFLSYSHADGRVAARVHARLEAFHIDKELVGQETPAGPIPKSLRPIFRDRNDFVAGDSLNEQTLEALSCSAALILLASPRSTQSAYVNEEVRLFKARYPERPVVPLIIEGEPGGGARECFPPALRFKLDAQGGLTQEPENILAADLRQTGDGFDLALAKVAARLIGVAPDDLYRRAQRERRRLGRVRMTIATALAALALLSGGLAMFTHWQGRQLTEVQITVDEIDALVAKLLAVQPAQAAVPDQRKSLHEAITAIAQGAAVDPRKAEALRLLREGKSTEAEPLLLEAIEERAKRREREIKEDAADYRHLASIAAVHDPGKARDYYAKAATLDPANADGLERLGWFQLQAKNLDAAEKSYRALLQLEGKGADAGQILWARSGLGDIFVARGHLPAALEAYGEARRAAMERLASSDSGSAEWQRNLSLSYGRIGDVLASQGNLAEALKSNRAGLAIAERLASSDSGNAEWQRDLSVFYDRIGNALASQGNLAEALKSYRAVLAIRERLASSDSGNAEWQRDLSVTYDHIGDVLVKQGNLAEALKSYRAGLAIAERLASSDSGNAEWQRDLSVTYDHIGDVLVKQGNLAEALKSYRAEMAIRERLASSDSGSAEWQSDLSVSYNNIGDVLVKQGNLAEALKSYRAALAIAERLASSDSSNAEWQRDLSSSYDHIGEVLVSQGNLAEALKSHRAALGIRERLASSDADNAEWQSDLSVSYNNIGEVLVSQGNLAEALKSHRAARAIRERLASSDASNAEWQRSLSVSYDNIADVLVKQGDLAEALKSYRAGNVIFERLASSDADNAEWQSDLSLSYDNIADVLVKQGDLAEALKSYRAGNVIFERLASSDADNAEWQRNLSISYVKLGNVLVKQGNLAEALKSYRAGNVIFERLASSDADNAEWQRDLIASCIRIAVMFPGEARIMLTRAKMIAAHLRADGRLAPADAGIPDLIAKLLASLKDKKGHR